MKDVGEVFFSSFCLSSFKPFILRVYLLIVADVNLVLFSILILSPTFMYFFLSHQGEFEGIANQFENHDHVRLILKYDESLSHCIYAASDMFIVPSIFEPCGLTQVLLSTFVLEQKAL